MFLQKNYEEIVYSKRLIIVVIIIVIITTILVKFTAIKLQTLKNHQVGRGINW
jgi:hypothetical protein